MHCWGDILYPSSAYSAFTFVCVCLFLCVFVCVYAFVCLFVFMPVCVCVCVCRREFGCALVK